MTAHQQKSRGWIVRLLILVILVPGLGVGLLSVLDKVNLQAKAQAARSDNAETRKKTLDWISSEREKRLWRVIHGSLENEQDRAILEIAGRAAARLENRGNLELLRRRADEGPDDPVRAKLIIFAAQLSNRDVRLIPWLEAGVAAGDQPWRQVGSAVGLVEIGQPAGGLALMNIARQVDHPARGYAYDELKRIGSLLTETLGSPIRWPDSCETTDEAFWKALTDFWDRNTTPRLLADVLTSRYGHDPAAFELGRLRHAREKVARLFR